MSEGFCSSSIVDFVFRRHLVASDFFDMNCDGPSDVQTGKHTCLRKRTYVIVRSITYLVNITYVGILIYLNNIHVAALYAHKEVSIECKWKLMYLELIPNLVRHRSAG